MKNYYYIFSHNLGSYSFMNNINKITIIHRSNLKKVKVTFFLSTHYL